MSTVSRDHHPAQRNAPSGNPLWHSDFYRIRKKVLTIGNKYWFEDYGGNILGFSKQKLFKLKEDIRIYTDETLSQELFYIKQRQMVDAWGKFDVFDTNTSQMLGYFRRRWTSGIVMDEWEIYDPQDTMIGMIAEGGGRGMLRKFLPIIPEKVTVSLHGKPVAEIKQKFKIIGDIWELHCAYIPKDFDRRVLLGAMLMMGMIERDRK